MPPPVRRHVVRRAVVGGSAAGALSDDRFRLHRQAALGVLRPKRDRPAVAGSAANRERRDIEQRAHRAKTELFQRRFGIPSHQVHQQRRDQGAMYDQPG